MKASAFEFRFRIWIGLAIYLLGFFAPWEGLRVTVNRQHLWSWLAILLFDTNHFKGDQSFLMVAAVACALAAFGALLRVWGNAHLGYDVVHAAAIQGAAVVAAGPYRYLRNPLYLGSWLTEMAIAILMPPSGAVFFLLAMTVFQLRLIGAEEAFLTAKLGDAYREYAKRVPRLLPWRRPLQAPAQAPTRWGRAILGETFPLGIAICFAVLAWRFDVGLLTSCVVVCFGASLIVRALLPRRHGSSATQE